MIRRPTVDELGPRHFRVVDVAFEPVGRDLRPLGLALVAAAVGLFMFVRNDVTREPLLPMLFLGVAVLGILLIVRAPVWRTRRTLAEVNLSEGTVELPGESHNGSGRSWRTLGVEEVDELLFAMREMPINSRRPDRGGVDAFALYLRTMDGELHPIIEASLDHDRTFRTARFLADALDVGIKQVGKGWKDKEPES